ncbi:ABC transporter ATP-binding protein [Proteiniclasticum sp. BAD-10]|uniref:ABC transporter ATP-binding protein n=1 Tax=Proteiniclasticum sediminis TaxID=2804028 RepID=A0A941CQ81_9CLOT|nr:ABC transporter ATP-binding protein [Proteiniclasticum sediminis]MBR0576901.1 ABC transporter ATP-binding protein [Proteiniclasticum sediminis]
MDNRLVIKNIAKSFGGVKAVQDISIEVGHQQIVSIIGPNGAGKTTVFNLISGIYPVDQGSVTFLGENITNRPQHLITRAGIARTFQNIRLFKGLTVLENVMTAHDPMIRYNLLDSLLATPKKRRMDKENQQLSEYYLDLVGLSAVKDEDPFNLPYGHQRKLEIARALATYPKVLLLDEPAAGLNTVEVQDLIKLIEKIHRTLDISIVIIDHRMELIMDLSEKIYVLNFGKLLAEGTPEEIQNNDDVTKAYIGEGY